MRFRVVIAGGGVAGLEALLALRARVSDRARIEVLAPEREFRLRQLGVAEPFGLGEVARFDLTTLVEDAGGVHRQDSLRSLRPDERTAITTAGAEIPYDALLLALGAHPREALPGATTYGGIESNAAVRMAVLALLRDEIERLAFAVPAGVGWPLPIYELALLAASHLADVGGPAGRIALVTHEAAPLAGFGRGVTDAVAALLDDAGIELHAGIAPARFADGQLALMNGAGVPCDRVIALPALEVDPVPGVPQGPHGFIDTDLEMRVGGLERVFAAGDATWFPIKQGGIAAQQADAAASAIAALIAPACEPVPFRPVLRAAMLTGSEPRYLRTELGNGNGRAVEASAPLWWPPSKVAGRYLAPYLADHGARANQPSPPLTDLADANGAGAMEHREAVELALTAADMDARSGDYRGALRWLEVARQLDLTLDPDYLLKRDQWHRAIAAKGRRASGGQVAAPK
jgi:sulfide:quinone oxidoreductase